MAKTKRLGDTNPATEVIRKCFFAVKNDPNNTFSFHKPEGVNWNFEQVYKRLRDDHPELWQEYGRPDTARLRQFFRNEITKYNTEQGERGTRPGECRRGVFFFPFIMTCCLIFIFCICSPPAQSNHVRRFMCETGFEEEEYSPDADDNFDDFDFQSVASDEQPSDLSDIDDLKMPPKRASRDPTPSKKKAAAATAGSSSAGRIVKSGEDMTTVLIYANGFDRHVMLMRLVRTNGAEAELIADGGAIQINESWPAWLFKKALLTQKSVTKGAPELKISSDAIVASHCKQIAAIKPDPQKPTIDSVVVPLPFLCKPINDTSNYVERKNGLYVFEIEDCHIMFIFLKDASASYQKDKKKKTKATKIDIGSLNIDSDNSDDDPDYDPEEDDWYDPDADAAVYMEDLVRIFGNVRDAQAAVNALNAGGEEREKYLKIIYHMKKIRDHVSGDSGGGGMDVDDEEGEEDDGL